MNFDKPAGLSDEVWDSIVNPAPLVRCGDCRHCHPVPEELKRKGCAHSYCDVGKSVYKTTGVQVNGKWYNRVSAKQEIGCKHYEELEKGGRK